MSETRSKPTAGDDDPREQRLRQLQAEYEAKFDDLPAMRIDTTLPESIALIKKALERGRPLDDDDFPDVPPGVVV